MIFENEIACGIFRHAQLKNGEPVNPHASKEECDNLSEKKLIYGCGKPFQIINKKVYKCDYI